MKNFINIMITSYFPSLVADKVLGEPTTVNFGPIRQNIETNYAEKAQSGVI